MDAFELVGRLTLDSSGVTAGLNAAETKSGFSAWGVTVGNLAARAFSSTFSAATKFARSIFETGMDFDAQLSSVNAIKDFTEEEFNSIREEAIELGRTTKYTATEVGEGFYYMGLAGWNSTQMLAGIEPVLNLAAASGENLGRASDIVTDALTAFGYKAEDAAMFVDVLAQASANSNTTVSMMGEAFKYLAPVAGSLNYSVQDVAVGLGLLANSGIKASQAGTSLRQILGTLENPSAEAGKAMEELGIRLDDDTGKIKPFKQLVGELRDIYQNSDFNPKEGRTVEEITAATEEYAATVEMLNEQLQAGSLTEKDFSEMLGDAQKKYSDYVHFNAKFLSQLGEIGGLRGISSLLAIMMSTDEDYDKLVQSIEDSEGAAEGMRDKQIDNLKGDITLLNSALDGLKILVSDEYKNDLRGFVSVFTEEIGKMGDAFSEGGLSGMFINLTDWIINGITDTLSDPKITVEGATEFGQALGDFVGHLVSTLITSAPEVISGLFTAGESLATGLIEGLFAGLFGVGEGSVYGIIDNIESEQKKAVDEANQTAIKAQGIVGYMESLSAKYGDAAKNTEEWSKSLERLKQLLPDINADISSSTTELSAYIEQSRQIAIQKAADKALEDLRAQYAQAQVDYAFQEGERQYNEAMANAALEKVVSAVSQWQADQFGMKSAEELRSGWYESFQNNPKGTWAELMNRVAIGGLQYDDPELESAQKVYEESTAAAQKNAESMATLATNAETLAAKLSFAEQAVATVNTASMQEGFDAAASASSSLASRMNSVSVPSFAGGSEDGSNAKGNWDVPYDNYAAILHRNEMVLTATQARQYREGRGNSLDAATLAQAMRSAVLDLTMELNGEAVGRVFGDQTTRRVNHNISQINRRHRYGYGG